MPYLSEPLPQPDDRPDDPAWTAADDDRDDPRMPEPAREVERDG